MKKNKVRQSIIDWSNKFPLDRWWRKKYNISYLSTDHRESSFYQQYYEYYEDLLFKEFQEERESKNDFEEPVKYIPLQNNWWKGKEVSKDEIDDWFKTPI